MLTETENVVRYNHDASVVEFPIGFPYWSKDEIEVYLTRSDGRLDRLSDSQYNLSEPDERGTLTKEGDWGEWTKLTIYRTVPHTQGVDLQNGMKIDAETLEDALDSLTAQMQQLSEAQSRAIYSSIDEAGGDFTIPNEMARRGEGSGTILGFSPDGKSMILRDLAQFDRDVQNTSDNASSALASKESAQGSYENAQRIADGLPGMVDSYVEGTAKPAISGYVEGTAKPSVGAYVESVAKPSILSYAQGKVNEDVASAITNTVIPTANTYINTTVEPLVQRAENAQSSAILAKSGAENAKAGADEAQRLAEVAQTNAENARDLASSFASDSQASADESRRWAETSHVVGSVVQETGESTTDVMSQKAVTDLIGSGAASVHVGPEPPEDNSNMWVDTDEDGEVAMLVVPIGTILPYGGQTTPVGYLLCDGHSESKATYPALFEAIGYTYGGSGDNFNLPNLTGRFLEGSSVAGTAKEAGLPNIEGTWSVGNTYSPYLDGTTTGVLSLPDGVSVDRKYDNAINGGSSRNTLALDASKGGTDPVYGKSTTVQPPSVTVRYVIKAYNSVTTESSEVEIEAQISGISERTAFLEASAIVAQGGNDNTGYYIRYENGTQICWKQNPRASYDVSTAWGQIYETSSAIDLGNFPMPFVALPSLSISIDALHAVIVENSRYTNISAGDVYLVRGDRATNAFVGIGYIAIGRWK